MRYVVTSDQQDTCVFCAHADGAPDPATGVLARARHNFVVLNAFPYNSGHLLVVPYEHQHDFPCLPAETVHELVVLTQLAVGVLQQEFRCEGANVGMNIGKAAGAGIKDHIHMHVVPRWTGDTNFMTALDETRVVPEALESSWERLAGPLQQALAEVLGIA
jgi:ATP adenylyltransferase